MTVGKGPVPDGVEGSMYDLSFSKFWPNAGCNKKSKAVRTRKIFTVIFL